MSYALETKKRKFERILDSLTDPAALPSRTTSNTNAIISDGSLSQSSTVSSSKRRRVAPGQNVLRNTSSTASLSAHYLPSSRAAFLERLETFRNVTKWHIPSTSSVNAAEWAKKGWLCEDTDTVLCPSCKVKIHVDLEVQDRIVDHEDIVDQVEQEQEQDNSFAMTNAIYEGLLERYSKMIKDAHTDKCPWRERGCDSSIQRIEGLLNTTNVITSLTSRYASIMERSKALPQVAPLPLIETHQINETELDTFKILDGQTCQSDALALAICGWQPKDNDVVECRHCFRSLGLWLYRGDLPTMEHLDPVDSHLEYCPWRSAKAQDTEGMSVASSQQGKSHSTEKQPGWLLVYSAIVKTNLKAQSQQAGRTVVKTGVDDAAFETHEMTPDQRETKMKDLRQRIRDLKKPFNFKGLLRKKDKAVTT